MSASEWLEFINPFIAITIGMVILSTISIPSTWRKALQIPEVQKALFLKKTIFVLIGILGLSWILAWLAPHITIPIICVNVMATSQLLSVPTLIVISFVMLIRIFQQNNILSLVFIILIRNLPTMLKIAGKFFSIFFVILAEASKNSRHKLEEDEKLDESEDPYADPKSCLNYRGEYCDKAKTNWY